MQMSPEINKLAEALSKAQGEMKPAAKSKKGGSHGNLYATLEDVWEAIKEPLSKYGLSIMQGVEESPSGGCLTTILAHSSGQWVKTSIPLLPKDRTAQSYGGAMTYAKRYAINALIGCTAEEDNDEQPNSYEVEKPHKPAPSPASAQSAPSGLAPELATASQVNYMKQLAKGCSPDLVDGLFDGYGINSFDQVTKKQAQEIIDKMKPQPTNPQAK